MRKRSTIRTGMEGYSVLFPRHSECQQAMISINMNSPDQGFILRKSREQQQLHTAVLREAWSMLPESSSLPLPAILAQSRNLAHASLETAVDARSDTAFAFRSRIFSSCGFSSPRRRGLVINWARQCRMLRGFSIKCLRRPSE